MILMLMRNCTNCNPADDLDVDNCTNCNPWSDDVHDVDDVDNCINCTNCNPGSDDDNCTNDVGDVELHQLQPLV